MKAIRTITVDGFEIVVSLASPVCDPMATKQAAKAKLGDGASYRELLAEMQRTPAYFEHVRGQENISDSEAETLEILLHKAGKHERVTRDGKIICDNRGRPWCRYENGSWEHGEIDRIGETLPDGALWRSDLSVKQLRTIHEQEELEKIALLSPESRIQASEVEIEAAKRAAVIKRMEAEITEDPEGLENARRWYRREIARIETKYNLPKTKNYNGS